MLIKKDGFWFSEYDRDELIVESARISETIEYINQNNISKVAIRGMRDFYTLDNVDFLSKCPSVSSVFLTVAGVNNFNGLYDMEKLISLFVGDGVVGIDLSALKDLKIFGGRMENTTNIDKCIGLKTLTASGKFPSRNLEELENLTNLEELKITQANITTLKGISGLKKLRKLELYYLRTLTDISELENVSATLKELVIENCSKLSGYETFDKLDKLEKLIVCKCPVIPNLSFVSKMPLLKHFSFVETVLEDGDLSPCTGVEYVAFNNKKHYSHTFEQLNPKQVKSVKESVANTPTWIAVLNDIEFETDYFVSLSVNLNDETIKCETKDNRGDNTKFRNYIYDNCTKIFTDKEFDEMLPDCILRDERFTEAMKRIEI